MYEGGIPKSKIILIFLNKNGVGFSSEREVEEVVEGIDPIQPSISTIVIQVHLIIRISLINFHM